MSTAYRQKFKFEMNNEENNIITQVLNRYGIDEQFQPFGNGHINDTYIVGDYVVQRLNTNVFPNYKELMRNVELVTTYLKKKIQSAGGDPERETLTIIHTIDGYSYVETTEGVFRVYKLIQGAKSYDSVSPSRFYEAGYGFGKFQSLLSDFPANELFEVIPDFHNTRSRFNQFLSSLKEDAAGRKKFVSEEVDFILSRENYVDVINSNIKENKIPLRVTHNDTKLNNVMLDDISGKAVCVIDLDTVMPGSLLYDYGDAIRYGASTAAEDETDLSKVNFDLALFKSFTEGFIQGLNGLYTDNEIKLFPFSAKLLTFECGMRFLTDYLNGDKYFKISRPEHNLDRARTQFKLVSEMEKAEDKMNLIVQDILKQ